MTFAHISLIALCFYLSVQSIYSHSETRRLVTEDGHLTQEDKDTIVQYHNEKRAELSIPDAVKLKSRDGRDVYAPKAVHALPYLAWSDELEYVAKYLMADCWYGHRDKPRMDAWRAVTYPESREFPGENIASSGYGPTAVLRDRFAPVEAQLDGWWSEHLLYEWAKLTKDDPDFTKIGHFRQMASEVTTHIGCAARYCPAGVYDDGILETRFTFLLYCNYYPGGNTYGYYPYNNDPRRRITPTFTEVKQMQRENGIDERTIHGLCQTLEDEGREEYQYYKCSVSAGVYFECEILPTVREDFFETAHFTQFLKEKYGWEFQEINEGPKLKRKNWIVRGLLKKKPSASSASGTMVGAPLHGLSKTRETPPTTHGTKLMTLESKFPERSETASGTPGRHHAPVHGLPMRTVESKFVEKPKAFSKLGDKRSIGASSTIKVPMDTASFIKRATSIRAHDMEATPMERASTMTAAGTPMKVRRQVKVHSKKKWHMCKTAAMGRGFLCRISCAKDRKWLKENFPQFLKVTYGWIMKSIHITGCKKGEKKYWTVSGQI